MPSMRSNLPAVQPSHSTSQMINHQQQSNFSGFEKQYAMCLMGRCISILDLAMEAAQPMKLAQTWLVARFGEVGLSVVAFGTKVTCAAYKQIWKSLLESILLQLTQDLLSTHTVACSWDAARALLTMNSVELV